MHRDTGNPCARQLFEHSKDLAVQFFFVGDVISGIDLYLFGQGYRVLSPNCKSKIFCSSFQYKPG